MMIIGASLAYHYSEPRPTTLKATSLTILGVLLYVITAFSFLRVLTSAIYSIIARRLGVGRAAFIRFILRLLGSLIVGLGLLTIVHVPIVNLLLGGAIIGIILSVAAQQSLANFFASIIIVIDRPFAVGQSITINSGALGGEYKGKVLDISFSRTRLRLEDDSTVSLPNATLLSGAAVIVQLTEKELAQKK
jgi:small-conductance mechanosensitive channel